MAWEGVNRRRFPRVNYPCTVRIRRKGDAEMFNTATENIGCGGICIILPKDIGMFSRVETEIDLQNGNQSINCDGAVVWVVRKSNVDRNASCFFDTGIEFINLKEKDKSRIGNIIETCLKEDES